MKNPPFAGTVNNGVLRTQIYWQSQPTVSSTATTLVETGSKVSVKTPNFKSLRRSQLPNNPFSYDYSREERSNGTWNTQGTAYWRKAEGLVFGYAGGVWLQDLIQPSYDEPNRIAKSKLLTKLQGTTINLAQSYAERKQTVDLIAKTTNRIAAAALAIRRGNLRHAVDLLGIKHTGANLRKEIVPSPKNLSNYWLEYSYGWRPLLSDIFGSCEYLANAFYLKRPTVVSGMHETNVLKFKYPIRSATGGNNVSTEYAYSRTKAKVRYVVEFCEDDAFLQRMASTGISNPLLLGWELLPYSFVADWFLPVGQYLQHLQASNGLFFKRGVMIETGNSSHSTTWAAVGTDPGGEKMTGSSRRFVFIHKKRLVLSSFPSPSLPSLQFPIQTSQFLSGLSLLTQAFKR